MLLGREEVEEQTQPREVGRGWQTGRRGLVAAVAVERVAVAATGPTAAAAEGSAHQW